MLDLLDLPPKQKLSTKAHNDIEMRVGMIKELVNVRDGKMTLSGDMFSLADVCVLIDFCVATSFSFLLYSFFIVYLHLYFVYDF